MSNEKQCLCCLGEECVYVCVCVQIDKHVITCFGRDWLFYKVHRQDWEKRVSKNILTVIKNNNIINTCLIAKG